MLIRRNFGVSFVSHLIHLKYSTTTTTSKSQNLIYVGPVNQMVKRMKTFSIGSSLTSTALAPALIYFSADHWSLFAKFGLVSSGTYTHTNAQIFIF